MHDIYHPSRPVEIPPSVDHSMDELHRRTHPRYNDDEEDGNIVRMLSNYHGSLFHNDTTETTDIVETMETVGIDDDTGGSADQACGVSSSTSDYINKEFEELSLALMVCNKRLLISTNQIHVRFPSLAENHRYRRLYQEWVDRAISWFIHAIDLRDETRFFGFIPWDEQHAVFDTSLVGSIGSERYEKKVRVVGCLPQRIDKEAQTIELLMDTVTFDGGDFFSNATIVNGKSNKKKRDIHTVENEGGTRW